MATPILRVRPVSEVLVMVPRRERKATRSYLIVVIFIYFVPKEITHASGSQTAPVFFYDHLTVQYGERSDNGEKIVDNSLATYPVFEMKKKLWIIFQRCGSM